MPIYEYRCDKCGKLSEFLESHGSGAAKVCKHCGGSNLQKQLSTFAPRIKAGDSKRCHGCADQKCPYSGN